MEASHISAPLMRIIEDVYRRDLVVYFRVHVRVIVKALMRFDTRYIAKGYLFAVFDCLLSSIFEGGGLSITSVNMLQALPNSCNPGRSRAKSAPPTSVFSCPSICLSITHARNHLVIVLTRSVPPQT